MSASVGKRTLLAVLRTMYICGAICGGKIAEPAKKIIYQRYVAEREGFEPSRRLPAYTRSRRAPSTTRPPLLQSRKSAQLKGSDHPLQANRCAREDAIIRIVLSSGRRCGEMHMSLSRRDLNVMAQSLI